MRGNPMVVKNPNTILNKYMQCPGSRLDDLSCREREGGVSEWHGAFISLYNGTDPTFYASSSIASA